MKTRHLFVFASLALFVFTAQCTATATQPPTVAPVKPPTAAVPTKPSATTPVKPPTVAPVQPPAAAPVKPPTAAAPTQAPAAPAGLDGKALVAERCADCHSLSRATRARTDAAGWKDIVDQMINAGAQLSPDEETAVVNYLAQTYK